MQTSSRRSPWQPWVIDHAAAYLLPASFPFSWEMRLIGRITAPIMCFFIAEGYAHTSNLRRYALRLLFFAAVSHIPFLLLHGGLSQFFETTGVIWTLLMGLLALSFGKRNGSRCGCGWGLSLPVVCWPSRRIGDGSAFFGCLASACAGKQGAGGRRLFCGRRSLYHPWVVCAAQPVHCEPARCVFVPALLWLYNGKHGSRSRVLQASYYWFYPVHLLAIWGIRLLTL